jgi:hypothetical protein
VRIFSGIFPGFKRKPRRWAPVAMGPSCEHSCVSCAYYDRVFQITSSDGLRRDCFLSKAAHVIACTTGRRDSVCKVGAL